MDVALRLVDVTKRFGDFIAVDRLSLEIPKGCIYGFLGPNGAGKTTTIRMIMSIFYPDEGQIQILGHPSSEEIKDRLGYLPEEKGLYKKMNTRDLVAYFGSLKGMPSKQAKEKAEALLHKYGLGDWTQKKCEALSKGMGQKVQVLGTLIHDPELVILDEPFSGLDPVNVEMMRNLILELKAQGRTVIFSTHVMEQAEQICDYIFLINKGKKVLDGPLAKVRAAGGKAIRVEYDGDGAALREIPGVARLNDAGKYAEVILEDGHDSQEFLKALVARLRIRKFDLSEPSLHEIFIRAVGGKSNE